MAPPFGFSLTLSALRSSSAAPPPLPAPGAAPDLPVVVFASTVPGAASSVTVSAANASSVRITIAGVGTLTGAPGEAIAFVNPAAGSYGWTATASNAWGSSAAREGVLEIAAAVAGVLSSVAGSGWSATWAAGTPPAFSPDTAPEVVSVQSPGFDASGAAVTRSRDIVVTKRLRQPYPAAVVSGGAVSVSGWTAADVVLSDYIYAGDVVPGAANGSALVAPKPLATWAMPDLRVVGDSLDVAIVAAHRDARDGEQIAAVKFMATDGTATVEQIVSASSLITESYDKNAVIGYKATLNIASLGANVTVNALVYPHFGGADSILDSAAVTNRYRLSPRLFAHKPSKVRRYAYVVEGHANGISGVTSTDLATAKATPYSSIANALRYGLAAGGADCDGDAVVIGSDITVASPITCAINVVTDRGDLTIMRDPDVPRASARLLNLAGTPKIFPSGSRPTRLRIEDMTVLRGTGSIVGASADRALEVLLYNCDYDVGTATGPFGTNCTGRFIGCTFSGGGNGTFNNVGFIRGCDGTLAGDMVPTGNIIGCAVSGISYVSNPYMIAFNRFLRVPAATTAFYTGGSGGAQAALMQNVIEPVVQNTNVLRISGDSDTASTLHQVLHHNYVGGNIAAGGTTRNNNFYDENETTPRTHELMSLIGNIFIGPCATKGDIFRVDSSRLGNWAYSHSVGCLYNIEARVLDAFPKDYRGLGHKVAANEASPLACPVVSDLSVSTGGAGGGDYRPAAGSPAIGMVRKSVLKWDLAGLARSAGGCSAGAHEVAA